MVFADREHDTELSEVTKIHVGNKQENTSVQSALKEASTMGNARMISMLEEIEDQDVDNTKAKETKKKGILGWGKEKVLGVKSYFQQTTQRIGNYFQEKKAKKEAKKRLSDISMEMFTESKGLTSDEQTVASERLANLRQQDNEQAVKSGRDQGSSFNRLEAGGWAFLIEEDQKYNESGESDATRINEDKKYTVDERGLIVEDAAEAVPAIDEELITDARQDFFSKTKVHKKISNFFGVGTTILDSLARSTKKKLKKEKKVTTAINDFIYKDFLHISNAMVTLSDDNTNKNMNISSKNIVILGQSGKNHNLDRTVLKGSIDLTYDAMEDTNSIVLNNGSIEKASLSYLKISASNLKLTDEGKKISIDSAAVEVQETLINTTNPLSTPILELDIKDLEVFEDGISWGNQSDANIPVGNLINSTNIFSAKFTLKDKERSRHVQSILEINKINATELGVNFDVDEKTGVFIRESKGWNLSSNKLTGTIGGISLWNYLNVTEATYGFLSEAGGFKQELRTTSCQIRTDIDSQVQNPTYVGSFAINRINQGLWHSEIGMVKGAKINFNSAYFTGVAVGLDFDNEKKLVATSTLLTINVGNSLQTTKTLELPNFKADNSGISWSRMEADVKDLEFRKIVLFENAKVIISEKNPNSAFASNVNFTNVITNYSLFDKTTMEAQGSLNYIDDKWHANVEKKETNDLKLFGGKMKIAGMGFDLDPVADKATIGGAGNFYFGKFTGTTTFQVAKDNTSITTTMNDTNIKIGRFKGSVGTSTYANGFEFNNVAIDVTKSEYDEKMANFATTKKRDLFSNFRIGGFGITIKKVSIGNDGPLISEFTYNKQLTVGIGGNTLEVDADTGSGFMQGNGIDKQFDFINCSFPLVSTLFDFASVRLSFKVAGGIKTPWSLTVARAAEDDKMDVTPTFGGLVNGYADVSAGIELGNRNLASAAYEAFGRADINASLLFNAQPIKVDLKKSGIDFSSFNVDIMGNSMANVKLGTRVQARSMFFKDKILYSGAYKEWSFGNLGYGAKLSYENKKLNISNFYGFVSNSPSKANENNEQAVKKKFNENDDGAGFKEYLEQIGDLYETIVEIKQDSNVEKIKTHMLDAEKFIENSGEVDGQVSTRKMLTTQAIIHKKTLKDDQDKLTKILYKCEKALAKKIKVVRPVAIERSKKHILRAENVYLLLRHIDNFMRRENLIEKAKSQTGQAELMELGIAYNYNTGSAINEASIKQVKNQKTGFKIEEKKWDYNTTVKKLNVRKGSNLDAEIEKKTRDITELEETIKIINDRISKENTSQDYGGIGTGFLGELFSDSRLLRKEEEKLEKLKRAKEEKEKEKRRNESFDELLNPKTFSVGNINRPEILENEASESSDSATTIEELSTYRDDMSAEFSRYSDLLGGLAVNDLQEIFSEKSAKSLTKESSFLDKMFRDKKELGRFAEVEKYSKSRTDYYFKRLTESDREIARLSNRQQDFDKESTRMAQMLMDLEAFKENKQAMDNGGKNINTVAEILQDAETGGINAKIEAFKKEQEASEEGAKRKIALLNHVEQVASDAVDEHKVEEDFTKEELAEIRLN